MSNQNEITHLSYSSITLFLDCPEAWYRKYIAKEPTFSTPNLVFGSAFHGTIEHMVQDKNVNPLSVYPDHLLFYKKSLWQQQWEKAMDGGQEIQWGLDTPEQHFNEGVRLLSNNGILDSIKSIKPAIDNDGPKIERKVELKVPGVPIPIIGYIDCILDNGMPADFKTSKASWSDAKASDSLQSLFYLAALNQSGDNSHNWAFTHFVFVKTKEPKFQRLEHHHKPSELFFLFEIISRVWKAIENQSFMINPTGWRCSPTYCDFYTKCRGRYE